LRSKAASGAHQGLLSAPSWRTVIIVPLGIMLVVKLVPPEIMAEHRAAALATLRPVSRVGAAVIVCLWIVTAAFLASTAIRWLN
jgi:hypothetical protein